MRPSDFPRGPDGVRFRVEFEESTQNWRVVPTDTFAHTWVCESALKSEADMVLAALNQVAEWEEKQRVDALPDNTE